MADGMLIGPGLEKTGLRDTGLTVQISQKNPDIQRMLSPGIKQLGVQTPGLRQAALPMRGIQPRRAQSVSARAQARGNFSMNQNMGNRNRSINPYS
jgi:hypothetical protein